MFDSALAFNGMKLEFANGSTPYDSTNFCEALVQVLPDQPLSDDASVAFKDKAQWFKDALKKDDGDACRSNCFYMDKRSYTEYMSPVCSFLFQQYSFLASQVVASNPVIQKVADEKRES